MDPEYFKKLNTTYAKIDEKFHKSMESIKQNGLKNIKTALINLKLILILIDEALDEPFNFNEELDKSNWEQACDIIRNIKKSRDQTITKIETLQALQDEHNAAEPKAIQPVRSHRSHSELMQFILSTIFSQNHDLMVKETLELIYLCERVKVLDALKLKQINNCVMGVFCLHEDESRNDASEDTYFIVIVQLNNAKDKTTTIMDYDIPFDNIWIHRLLPGEEECGVSGDWLICSGIDTPFCVLVPEICIVTFRKILEAILVHIEDVSSICPMSQQEPSDEVIYNSIVDNSENISKKLIRTSSRVGEFISTNTPYVKSYINGATGDSKPVSAGVMKGISYAKAGTSGAAQATGYVADKIGVAMTALGMFLAPHIQAQGTKLLSHTTSLSMDEAAEKMKFGLAVAGGTITGIGTIYNGIEASAAVIGTSLSTSSVTLIEHKYGPTAGTLAADSLDTVGNIINIGKNVRNITPKAIVKNTAKNTGKALVTHINPLSGETSENFNVIPVYPEFTEFWIALKK